MIFDNVENKCLLSVLRILKKKETRYSDLFRETKVSHTTLQKVLKDLESHKFISKDGFYSIGAQGKEFLNKLEELEKFVYA